MLLTAIRAGCWLNEAAQVAGVSRRALTNWLAWGRESLERCDQEPAAEPDEPYHSFAAEVLKEQARLEMLLLARIQKAGESDWKAAAWLLSKRNPRRYGDRLELAGSEDEPIRVEASTVVVGMAADQRAAITAQAMAELGLASVPVEVLAIEEGDGDGST